MKSLRTDGPLPRAGGTPPPGAPHVLLLVVVVGLVTWSAGRPGPPGGVDPTPGSAGVADRTCEAPEHRRFDFWVGEWDVTNRQRNPARPDDETLYETGTATDRVYTILDGCAVVEHWEGHLLPDRHVLGFSVRAWDPGRRTWVALLNWPGPAGPSFLTMEGGFADSVATFNSESPAGGRVRYRFRDIEDDRLRWVGARRDPEEQSWSTFWEMDFRRRDPERDPALLNGPARSTDRCPDERSRAYDFLVGDWIGEIENAEGSARPVTLRAWAILEGCAVMEFITVGEGDAKTERFRISSYVPQEERWVRYSVRPTSPALVRWEGSGEDPYALTRVTDVRGEPATRVHYRQIESDSFVRELRAPSDDPSGWTTVSRTKFRSR